MPWILLLIAAVCFALTFTTNLSFLMTVILLLAALGFLCAGILSYLSVRLASNRRDDTKMISPEELRMMREQAAARKNAANTNSDTDPTL